MIQGGAMEDLGGTIVSGPAAVSAGRGLNSEIHCFALGINNHILHKFGRSTWSDWEDLGGNFIDAPAVASWRFDRLDVFARGTDNHLWHKHWNGSSWSNWEDLGGTLSAGPAAVSRAENLIDCVVRGMDGHVYHKSFDRYGWSDWKDLGGFIIGAPAIRPGDEIHYMFLGEEAIINYGLGIGMGNGGPNGKKLGAHYCL